MALADSVSGLPASITAGNCQAVLAQLEARLAGAGGITVDGAALTRFDSSALALLLSLRRSALDGGKSFACLNLPGNLRKLALVYGVDGLL